MLLLRQSAVSSVVLLALLSGGGAVGAPSGYMQKAQNPFDNNADNLPDLGMAPEGDATARHIATVAKAFGEASQTESDLAPGQQARQFAFTRLRDAISEQVTSEAESLLSPLGTANIDLLVDEHGNFNGSSGSLFTPWQDNNRYLTWTQLGVSERSDGLVGNAGVGQRWVAGDWLLGYNTFYDSLLEENLQRAGFGAEAWGEYLRLSANYYQPLSGWREGESETQEQRLARGYDVTAQAWLPFYRHINTSLSLEQYFGDRVDLFDSGTGYHNPVAVKVGLSYTPVPLVTVSAQHKQGESGESQNNLGLRVNYRFGVPLGKQLSAAEVATTSSLRGSRYDRVERSGAPVVEFRQRKTLSVFLATPPWDLNPGETVALKLQMRSLHGIRQLSWQGDTQALSLTPPLNGRSADGWSIIMPAWDSTPGASNSWRLSVTVEDERGQRVTSNWITLRLTEPVQALPQDDPRYNLLPEN
ncbi:YchO/YchP family invasin [Franconibacter helveticus]|uniref:YchO/YchP family invasin n=1 Tax=Franconibacter helveticus TaxID=357240 RepID=UPI000DA22CF9|nr:YchO/YchP family invasin [Franconibacter helveticus]